MVAELAEPGAPDFEPLPAGADVEAVLARIEAAGIVGLGGGGYPTARKVRQAIAAGADVVIGNGMGTEPGVTADVALLRECRAEVVAGLDIVAQCLGDACRLVAVPPGDAEAPMVAVDLPYPSGEERRLVAHLTGRTVPKDGFPTDCAVLVLNVATLFAVFDAVRRGRRLARRIVSVGGTDYWVPIGLPLRELPLDAPTGLRMRGALTGVPAPADGVVAPTTFAVSPAPAPALACIRCGWCRDACPEGLAPERLHDAFVAGKEDDSIFDCIECGACTAACPSRLDLVGEFRAMKSRLRRERAVRARADDARRRSEARTERLARHAAARQQARQVRLRTPHEW